MILLPSKRRQLFAGNMAEPGDFEDAFEDEFEDAFEGVEPREPAPASGGETHAKNQFVDLSPEEIEALCTAQENLSTSRKTLAHVNVFKNYLSHKLNETRPVHTIPPAELDPLLGNFFWRVRKANGENFEPCYLKNMQNSLERHLKNRKYPVSLTSDREFNESRKQLKSKQIELKKQGRGNRPNAAHALSDTDVDLLWGSGALGSKDPDTLIRSLWWVNTTQFGMRAGHKEHLAMCWGDIQLQRNPDGIEYLEKIIERQTKTRSGENPENTRKIKPTAYATHDERCPVELYKLYSKNRPADMCKPDSPYYLGTMHNPKQDQIWYRRQNLGPNKLGGFMQKLTEEAGIVGGEKKLTNTSARKYLVQTLNDSNVPPTHIAQITGHKSLASINNYCSLNNLQKKDYSLTLSRPGMKRPAPSTITSAIAPPPNTVSCSSTSSTASSSMITQPCAAPTGPLNLFAGATITGGTINITIRQASPSQSHSKVQKIDCVTSTMPALSRSHSQ
jgi:hypothetical protein